MQLRERDEMPDGEEMRLIQRLAQEIERLKLGLDPDVLAAWYRKVEMDAKARAPDHLKESIQVIRDPILTMKFEFKTSRRAVGKVVEAIDGEPRGHAFGDEALFPEALGAHPGPSDGLSALRPKVESGI